jgi:hypothetical protein
VHLLTVRCQRGMWGGETLGKGGAELWAGTHLLDELIVLHELGHLGIVAYAGIADVGDQNARYHSSLEALSTTTRERRPTSGVSK